MVRNVSKQRLQRFGFGLTVALLSATAALASPAETRGPSYLYTDPSPRADILFSVPPRAYVDVVFCRRGWCRVSFRQRAGFIPADDLRFERGYGDRGYGEAPPPRVYVEPAPPVVVIDPFERRRHREYHDRY